MMCDDDDDIQWIWCLNINNRISVLASIRMIISKQLSRTSGIFLLERWRFNYNICVVLHNSDVHWILIQLKCYYFLKIQELYLFCCIIQEGLLIIFYELNCFFASLKIYQLILAENRMIILSTSCIWQPKDIIWLVSLLFLDISCPEWLLTFTHTFIWYWTKRQFKKSRLFQRHFFGWVHLLFHGRVRRKLKT